MSSKINDMLSSIIGKLKEIASTETIIGDSVDLGKKKVIPVSRLSIGFAVGGGEGESAGKSGGLMGAGGGGARVDPIGFILLEDESVSFLPVKPNKIEGLIEAIPAAIEKITEKKKKDE